MTSLPDLAMRGILVPCVDRSYNRVDRCVFVHIEEIRGFCENGGFICILNDNFYRGLVHVRPARNRVGTYVGSHHC